jgi:predicted 2-oxoglutarate/Fe(II)-dependent dioxygenase YbiX
MFHKTGYDGIKIMPTEWNIYTAKSWWYSVSTGDVILFPSNLMHEVPPTTSGANRISVAFNVFLKGRLGDYDELTELKII